MIAALLRASGRAQGLSAESASASRVCRISGLNSSPSMMLASLVDVSILVIFSIVISSPIALVALKNRHVRFVQYDPEQPIINLTGVGKTMFDHVDFSPAPLNDINVGIDEPCSRSRIHDGCKRREIDNNVIIRAAELVD